MKHPDFGKFFIKTPYWPANFSKVWKQLTYYKVSYSELISQIKLSVFPHCIYVIKKDWFDRIFAKKIENFTWIWSSKIERLWKSRLPELLFILVFESFSSEKKRSELTEFFPKTREFEVNLKQQDLKETPKNSIFPVK